jgi:hypothetical protein
MTPDQPGYVGCTLSIAPHGAMSQNTAFFIVMAMTTQNPTWSLTLREEHRLRLFENMVLSGIFGLKRDEVTGTLRNLHNEDLHNLYCLASIIKRIKSRKMRGAGHVALMKAKKNAYRREPEERRPLEKHRCR